jgi:uncharacterized protein (TIGR03546 family)
MLPVYKIVGDVIRILESDIAPSQIAAGFCFGMIMGLTPLWNLHNLFLLFLVLILRVNWGTLIFTLGLFTLFAYLLDPLSHMLGMKLLHAQAFQKFWTDLYNTPTLQWWKFNNTVVLGSVIISTLLSIPVFFLMRYMVISYREGSFKDWLEEKFGLVTKIKESKLYQWYEEHKEGGITRDEIADGIRGELDVGAKVKDSAYYRWYESLKSWKESKPYKIYERLKGWVG